MYIYNLNPVLSVFPLNQIVSLMGTSAGLKEIYSVLGSTKRVKMLPSRVTGCRILIHTNAWMFRQSLNNIRLVYTRVHIRNINSLASIVKKRAYIHKDGQQDGSCPKPIY